LNKDGGQQWAKERELEVLEGSEDARENSSDERRQRLRSSSSGSRRGRPPLVRPHPVPKEVCRTTDSSGDD